MEPHEIEEKLLRWRGMLFSVAYATLGDFADAEDAVAESLVRIVRHGDQLRDPEKLGAWARRIARNEARRLLARRKPTDALSDNVIASSKDSDLAVDVRAALDALPVSLAATLSGYYLRGESVVQLAMRLQVPEGTIQWRLARGRSLLKTSLKGYEPMKTLSAALVSSELSPDIRRTCAEALSRAGWSDVRCLTRWDDALALADSPTVGIVLDEWIDGRSAFELIPLLRADPARRILLLLDRDRPEAAFRASVSAAYVSGVDMLLSKPFSESDFAAFARRLREGTEGGEAE